MKKPTLQVLFVATTLLMSSSAFAQKMKVCFDDAQTYSEVKQSLPAMFQELPVLLTLGGFVSASIKVMDDGGKIRIQSAVWALGDLTYGNEIVKEACFDGVKNLEIKMWNGSDFHATMKGAKKVSITAKQGRGDFTMDSLQGYVNKVNYINNGAIQKGITPKFAAQ